MATANTANAVIDVGETVIQRVIEVEAMPAPVRFMFPNVSEQAVAEARTVLGPDVYDAAHDLVLLGVQSYVLRVGGRVILIDSCIGNDKERPHTPGMHRIQTEYLARLAAAGIRPDEVDLVLCTHLHPDHVGWNTRRQDGEWVPTFPKARYLIGREEFEEAKRLRALPPAHEMAQDLQTMFDDSVLPIERSGQLELVEGDHRIVHELDHGLRLEPAPGHSFGQLMVHVESGGEHAVLCADVIHHPIQLRDLSISQIGDLDRGQAQATRRRLVETYADTATLISPAHFPARNAGRFVTAGDAFGFDWLQG
jgi:glyoxylase-like metal-dependent hydrolase (beta-lactamase superfamily II)